MARHLICDGPPPSPRTSPVPFVSGLAVRLNAPGGYLPDPALKPAVNAALLLGQPLLLGGEPGVGKSSLARALAHALGLPCHEIFAHSELSRRDLFHEFDHLRRMFDVQAHDRRPPIDYLGLNALGLAIMAAAGPDRVATPLPGSETPEMSLAALARGALTLDGRPVTEATRSVVLIDEIDKAPRDLLNEVERMLFDIQELGLRVSADPEFRPVLVMTANSEKSLPEPFLRRCVFHYIQFPPLTPEEARERCPDVAPSEAPTLRDIVSQPISELSGGGALIDDAIALFSRMREAGRGFGRPPSTSELLNWLLLIVHDAGLGRTDTLQGRPDVLERYLSVLAKSPEDRRRAQDVVREWLGPTT